MSRAIGGSGGGGGDGCRASVVAEHLRLQGNGCCKAMAAGGWQWLPAIIVGWSGSRSTPGLSTDL
jgi:hypothetical protein